jgi:hypothetical protein
MNPELPPQSQSFVLTVTSQTQAATPSATVQLVGSNDNVNWVNYGAPLTATGTVSATANSFSAATSGTTPYRHFGAYLTAISGTGASCVLVMEA